MSKKNTAAQAKARQKKIARKENKRKEKRREVRHAAGEAAAAQRAADVAVAHANALWFDAEDAVGFLNDPSEEATEDDLDAALEDLAFDLEESLKLVAAGVGPENPNLEGSLRELGFEFGAAEHLRMTEALLEHAQRMDRPIILASAKIILSEWAILVTADTTARDQVGESFRFFAASDEERGTLMVERLRRQRGEAAPAGSSE